MSDKMRGIVAFDNRGRLVVILHYSEQENLAYVEPLDFDAKCKEMNLERLALTGIKIDKIIRNGVCDKETVVEALNKSDVTKKLGKICWDGNRTVFAYKPNQKPVEIKPLMIYEIGSVAFADHGRLVVILHFPKPGKQLAYVEAPDKDFQAREMKFEELALTGIKIDINTNGVPCNKKTLVEAIKNSDVKTQLQSIFLAGNGNFLEGSSKDNKPANMNFQNNKPAKMNFQNDKPAKMNFQNDKPAKMNFQNDKPAKMNFQNDKPAKMKFQNDKPAKMNFQNDKPAKMNFQNNKPAKTKGQGQA